ncbi:hypothetical protein ABBQ32_002385 [Trebouxia sp. C0010 RCD-2024]
MWRIADCILTSQMHSADGSNDLKEGQQNQAPQIVPWRVWSKRKAIYVSIYRKELIYRMLEAESSGQDLDEFMRPFHDAAVDAYKWSKRKSGNTTTVMKQLLKVMSTQWQARHMTPTKVEQDVLL